jgi:hypothetical protein
MTQNLSALADPEHQHVALPRLRFEQVAALRNQMWNVDCGQRVGALDGRDVS